MAIETSNVLELSSMAPRVSEFRRFTRVFFKRWVVVLGLAILLLVFIAAVFAPWIAPYDPYKIATGAALEQPSAKHWLRRRRGRRVALPGAEGRQFDRGVGV